VPERWRPGDAILIRHVWHGRVLIALAVTVVEHTSDVLATWIAPGAPYKRPSPRRRQLEWELVDRPWEAPGILQLMRPGAAHSLALFPGRWYVNLQEPLRPTPLGFDTCDQLLDLWREQDGTWRWKDEDELEDAVARGLYTVDEAAAIRAEAERVVAADPFPTGWEGWEPDPAWAIPSLPAGWDVV
jgi:Protein of unknown function (DUF402)